jgi:hypothetical protein
MAAAAQSGMSFESRITALEAAFKFSTYTPIAMAADAAAAPPRRDFAVVTMVASGSHFKLGRVRDTQQNGWLEGAVKLGCSLQPVRHVADFVAFCFGIEGHDFHQLQKSGWRCEGGAPEAKKAEGSRFFDRNPAERLPKHAMWHWDYTAKFAPFVLPHKRVVLIDSDMLVIRPSIVLELLFWPMRDGHILATRDCLSSLQREKGASNEVQGGLLVFRPSVEVQMRMRVAMNRTFSRDRGGQGFVSSYFNGNITWLPNRFNYVAHKGCAALYNPQSGMYELDDASVGQKVASVRKWADDGEDLVRSHLKSGAVGMIHFAFRPKPWNCNASLTNCGEQFNRYGGGAQYWDKETRDFSVHILHQTWHAARNECAPSAP